MVTKDSHVNRLLPETRAVLNASGDERIEYLKADKWIPYPRANEVLAKMEELFNEPPRVRMPSMLIVGEPNNGKSSLVKKFERDHPTPSTLTSGVRTSAATSTTPSPG